MNTREKGTEIGRKNETGDLLGEILGPWIPPEGKKKKKKKGPTQIYSCEEGNK